MRIFDPVHELIPFEGEHVLFNEKTYEILKEVLDTPEFQRLRRIRQLGFADLVYPGATHTRFAHSVGVFKNARDMLGIAHNHFEKNRHEDKEFDKERARITLLAALLHDVGHGPFSHVFEGAMKGIDNDRRSHEWWSMRIIGGEGSLNEALKRLGREWQIEDFDRKIKNFLGSENKSSDLYTEIVSSQFDADRMDYLQRDAYATGIDIGNFDRDWLIDCLRINHETDKPNWVVGLKGRQAVEAYLLARVQLYESIYLHPTNCGFNIVFRRLMGALSIALKNNDDLPPAVRSNPVVTYLGKVVKGEEKDLETYLAMDDAAAWMLINTLAADGEGELQRLAGCLASRRPLPFVRLEPLDPDRPLDEMKNKLAEFGGEIKNKFPLNDWQYDAKPLEIYSLNEEDNSKVYVQGQSGETYALNKISNLIQRTGEQGVLLLLPRVF